MTWFRYYSDAFLGWYFFVAITWLLLALKWLQSAAAEISLEWRPLQNINICIYKFKLVMDLDKSGWKDNGKFTLRLSWPAYVPFILWLFLFIRFLLIFWIIASYRHMSSSSMIQYIRWRLAESELKEYWYVFGKVSRLRCHRFWAHQVWNRHLMALVLVPLKNSVEDLIGFIFHPYF